MPAIAKREPTECVVSLCIICCLSATNSGNPNLQSPYCPTGHTYTTTVLHHSLAHPSPPTVPGREVSRHGPWRCVIRLPNVVCTKVLQKRPWQGVKPDPSGVDSP